MLMYHPGYMLLVFLIFINDIDNGMLASYLNLQMTLNWLAQFVLKLN